MRYSRYEFKGIGSRRLRRRLLIGIISVLIIAITSGYLISNWIPAKEIIGTTSKEDVKKYQYEKPDSRNYYVLQTGAFSSSDNAKSFAANMRAKGIPAYEHKEENLTVVFNFVYKDKKTAEEKSVLLKSGGFAYLIKEFQVSPGILSQELMSDNRYVLLSKLINGMGRLLDKRIERGMENTDESIADANGRYNIPGIKNTISDDIAELTDLQVSTGRLQDEITDKLDSIIGKLLDFNDGQISQPQYEEAIIEMLISYKDFVENFNRIVSAK